MSFRLSCSSISVDQTSIASPFFPRIPPFLFLITSPHLPSLPTLPVHLFIPLSAPQLSWPCRCHHAAYYVRFQHELKIISQQYPFEPIKYLRPSLRITFQEGIAMLRVSVIKHSHMYACVLRLCCKAILCVVGPLLSVSFYSIPFCPILSNPAVIFPTLVFKIKRFPPSTKLDTFKLCF